MSKIDTIRQVYDRFAKGDAAAILATFDEDIEFRLAEGHPYAPDGRAWIGGDAITENFFVKAAEDWRDWTFHVHDVIETPDADAQGCHVWRFRDGRISSFHQNIDTAQVQHVMGAPAWPPHEQPITFPGVAVPQT